MRPYALIADQDEARGGRTASLLSTSSFHVACVRDGREALSTIHQQGPPVLLVTDLSLPRVDGFSLICRLRATVGGEASRVIVLSGFRELREEAHAKRFELAIEEVLSVHVQPDLLRRILERSFTGTATRAPTPLPSPKDRPSSRDILSDSRRQMSIERSGVLRASSSDARLEEIVRTVARKFGVSIALVSVVLENKQWFKAKMGVGATSTPLDVSFCRHVVVAREPMVVPDATEHPVFRTNRMVRAGVVRGYAGAPLIGSDGETWGALCIIDPEKPLDLNATELDELGRLAGEVVAEIERNRALEAG